MRAMRLSGRVEFPYPTVSNALATFPLGDLTAGPHVSIATDGTYIYAHCAQGLLKVCVCESRVCQSARLRLGLWQSPFFCCVNISLVPLVSIGVFSQSHTISALCSTHRHCCVLSLVLALVAPPRACSCTKLRSGGWFTHDSHVDTIIIHLVCQHARGRHDRVRQWLPVVPLCRGSACAGYHHQHRQFG